MLFEYVGLELRFNLKMLHNFVLELHIGIYGMCVYRKVSFV